MTPRRRTSARPLGQPTPKSLSARYAEVLRLREVVTQAQSKLAQTNKKIRRSAK